MVILVFLFAVLCGVIVSSFLIPSNFKIYKKTNFNSIKPNSMQDEKRNKFSSTDWIYSNPFRDSNRVLCKCAGEVK